MEISILDTGSNSCLENMKIDEILLKTLNLNELPKLHLYSWQNDSATFGHFAKPEDLLDLKEVKKKRLQLAKRVTGGGVTFHFSDYAFTFLMPRAHPYFSENTLENYRFVNQFVLKAIEECLDHKEELSYCDPCQKNHFISRQFCMAKPTQYDVLYKGKKVGGAAQRKTSQGYLHHGTISIGLPDQEYLKDILKSKEEIFNAIYENTFYFVDNHKKKSEMEHFRHLIQKKLVEAFLEF